MSLKSLEARNVLLNNINSDIIEAKIDVNSTLLDLDEVGITRLPVTLFQAERYVNFWQSLTDLYCANNQLTELNVQGLVALQQFDCSNNQLTSLNVQGLAALQVLYCNDNQLAVLNVQGLVVLQTVKLKNNLFSDLNLTGVHADTKNKYAELERSLLFKQLIQVDSDEAKQWIIARLGADYTYKNCLYYCPVYATKWFASSALSQLSTFLPSFSMNSHKAEKPELKRKRDEEGMQIDLAEDSDDKPDFKRIKKD